MSFVPVDPVLAGNPVIVPLSAPVDDVLVERAAEAAYRAVMELPKDAPRYEPWVKLSEYWKRIYRVQVRAVLEVLS